MSDRIGNYVIQCIKSNKRFFGCSHKKGQYVTYEGIGTSDIAKAYVYNDFDDDTSGTQYCECPFEVKTAYKFYKIIPVKIVPINP